MKSFLNLMARACVAAAQATLFAASFIVSLNAGAQVLTLDPAQPSLLDVVRVRADSLASGQCPVADTQQVSMEGSTVKVTLNQFNGACPAGTYVVNDLAIGRFPKGNYVLQLQLKMASGAVQTIAEKAFSVKALPERFTTGAPVDDYSGIWVNSTYAGDALFVKQSGGNVVASLLVHGASGEPTWYVIPPGAWVRHTKEEYDLYSYPPILVSDIYRSQGVPFGGVAGGADNSSVVGSARITFVDLNNIVLFVKLNGPNGVETVRALSPLRF